jgi:arylsulfatase
MINSRREFLQQTGLGSAAFALQGETERKPNVLFLMADQFRFDAIAALGNSDIYTPNIDRLVNRGATFTNCYSPCPVCVPARYAIRTGCEPPRTGYYSNGKPHAGEGQADSVAGRCGPYLAETMKSLGYRTFGIGKFHSQPWNEKLGYDVHLHSEELYATPAQRKGDSFASWIATEHPAYDFIEGLMGERTEMYYMPQMSPMPAAVTVEGWAASRAVEQIQQRTPEPYFGFVSFIGPHPPFAPPIPFNRLYDPDRMPNPIRGDIAVDHMDEQIPWMNYIIWAEDINDSHTRVLRARYYGEITYIDDCIGRILDAVEARGDGDNTLICFFSDHGEHLGDHNAWQKESFFEASVHVPFVASWPGRIPAGVKRPQLVSLVDLFGLATSAAGKPEYRDGVDVLAALEKNAATRDTVMSYHETPGSPYFKMMVRSGKWKYIFMANGGREQLFDVESDPHESKNLASTQSSIARKFRSQAVAAIGGPHRKEALAESDLRAFPFTPRPRNRIYQFDHSRNVTGFPKGPKEELAKWRRA